MIFVKYNYMIKQLTANTQYQAFGHPVLPWALVGGYFGLDTQLMFKETIHSRGKNFILIHNEIFWNNIKGKSISELLYDPLCRRMIRNVEVNDIPSTVIDDEEDELDVKGESGNDEKVHGGNYITVVP